MQQEVNDSCQQALHLMQLMQMNFKKPTVWHLLFVFTYLYLAK